MASIRVLWFKGALEISALCQSPYEFELIFASVFLHELKSFSFHLLYVCNSFFISLASTVFAQPLEIIFVEVLRARTLSRSSACLGYILSSLAPSFLNRPSRQHILLGESESRKVYSSLTSVLLPDWGPHSWYYGLIHVATCSWADQIAWLFLVALNKLLHRQRGTWILFSISAIFGPWIQVFLLASLSENRCALFTSCIYLNSKPHKIFHDSSRCNLVHYQVRKDLLTLD